MLRDPALIPLSHQHQHGLALSVLIERGLKDDPSPEKTAGLCHKVAAMAAAELIHHFRIEEEILFPAVREAIADHAIIDDLIAQHRQMEDLISLLAQAAGDERISLLTEFGVLLSRHIRIEERQLFQDIQEKLPAQELAALGRRIDGLVRKICPNTNVLPW